MQNGNTNKIWELLDTVPDPEIPVISVVELGMINNVSVFKETIEVDITPTFIACPAINYIQENINTYLKEKTGKEIKVNLSFTPAWNSNRISKEGKEKLKKFGISPPKEHDGNVCFNKS